MKIFILCNNNFSMWNFQRGIIKALVAKGHDVTGITPAGPYTEQIRGLGAKHIAVPINRFISPMEDIRFGFNLYKIFRKHRPDIVHTMTAKPNIYGAIAAKVAGVPLVVSEVAGLGQSFEENIGLKRKLLQKTVSWMYRISASFSDRVMFLQQDDRQLFISNKIVALKKTVLVRSCGVNVDEFSKGKVPQEKQDDIKLKLSITPKQQLVVMAARIVWSKGVREFVEASKEAQKWPFPCRFLLLGHLESGSPGEVPESYLVENRSSTFQWCGFREDAREIYSMSDVVVLPSYYREAIPKAITEGMALSKPIVTTTCPGCRETVENGKNGFLVPPRDSHSLAKAIFTILNDAELKEEMGRHSRQKVEKEFSENIVVSGVLRELYQLAH